MQRYVKRSFQQSLPKAYCTRDFHDYKTKFRLCNGFRLNYTWLKYGWKLALSRCKVSWLTLTLKPKRPKESGFILIVTSDLSGGGWPLVEPGAVYTHKKKHKIYTQACKSGTRDVKGVNTSKVPQKLLVIGLVKIILFCLSFPNLSFFRVRTYRGENC